MNTNSNEKKEIKSWVWTSFIQAVRIPVIIFLLIFLILNTLNRLYVVDTMSDFLISQVQDELNKISEQDALNIEQQLTDINYLTDIYARQTAAALNTETTISNEDQDRLTYSSSGVYYTSSDTDEGGVAVFYSGYYPVGEAERSKVVSILQTQELMKDMQTSYPLVSQVYFNSYDSLNIIYPYFDVISQYPEYMNIPEYNFYYEADETYNPDRSVEWTDVYLDPAGQGWMASCIAPVYTDNFLEGVVGIDITVSTLTQQILDLDVPWEGYAMLIDSTGTILALPENGEEDWELSELTDYHYEEAIMEDTFKPDEFNLNNMENISDFSEEIYTDEKGISTITLNGQTKVASWNTIEGTDWKLLFIVPEDKIYSSINTIKNNEWLFGFTIFFTLLIVFLLLNHMLKKRINSLSEIISNPLVSINSMVSQIGKGEYVQEKMNFEILEIQNTSDHIIEMGSKLGKANEKLLKTQNDLEGRETYLQAILNSVEDAIYEINENGIITNFRTNDPRIIAHVFPEGINDSTSLASFMNKSEADEYLEILHNVLETGETTSIEYGIDTPRGMRWFLVRIQSLNNGLRNAVVSLRDITEQKRMEQKIDEARIEAEKANSAKSEFLSNMSHELRTPLNAVLGFSQLLQLDPEHPLNESQQESVHEIEKAGNHLLELINEVLDLAKIESGKMTISIEPVSISQIVEETFSLIKPIASQYNINLTSRYEDCNCYVLVDKTRLKQVLINIFSNAIKYNRENGSVTFYCEPAGNNIQFHVIDTGFGIPEEQMDEIFKPFNRLGNTKDIIEGTGIGLALAKQLIESMDGSINVESKLGEGSHFYIEVPKAYADEFIPESISEECKNELQELSSHRKHKLLYVEDNPANLNLVQRIISYIPDLELLHTSSAEVGIDIARAHYPDLILLDINLPGLDGFSMFKKLKNYPETAKIPVMAISANAMDSDIQKALDMGFIEYITKPIDVADFVNKLKNFFRKNM
jgi:PAS domain S-box-containing protein